MYKRSELVERFSSYYGGNVSDLEVFFCPGRVNLIGEHIDYNGGFVFPMALSQGIYALMRRRNDSKVFLRSEQCAEVCEVDLTSDISYDGRDNWANYPKGVLNLLLADKAKLSGADILFDSNLPIGAGVSSSAALEVLTAYMFLSESQGPDLDRVKLALLAQNAEREFVGVKCGIMDQFSVAMSKKDHALLLDCSSLEYRHVPFVLKAHTLVVMNSTKSRELAGSKYNERRGECEAALKLIQEKRDIDNLCQATVDEVESLVQDPVVRMRARHVVTEQKRVLAAVAALEKGDLSNFGRLLTESHRSLQKDYEVSCKELDLLVDGALKLPGCLGARMTGAGFGGCAIALVETPQVPDFTKNLGASYGAASGLKAEFIPSVSEDGVRKL